MALPATFKRRGPLYCLLVLAALLLLAHRMADAQHDASLPQVERYVQLLQRLAAYRPELPRSILARAIGIQGDRRRLEGVMLKLIQGDDVNVVLLGGGLTTRGWNYVDESFIAQVHKWLELTFVEGCRLGTGSDLHSQTSPAYRSTGHTCEGSRIHLVNLAAPAIGPGFAERCIMQRLPVNVDLLFLDFGCNDYADPKELHHPERKAFERLLRNALAQPRSPAVIAFEAYSWAQSSGKFMGMAAQDRHTVMAEYYGQVQVLAARAALYQMMAAANESTRLIHIGADDQLHVSTLGHRWYADLIISYLREVAVDLLSKLLAVEVLQQQPPQQPPQQVQQSAATLQQPQQELRLAFGLPLKAADGAANHGGISDGSDAAKDDAMRSGGGLRGSADGVTGLEGALAGVDGMQKSVDGGCFIQGSRGQAYPVACSSKALTQPFFRGNEALPLGVCAVGDTLVPAVLSPHDGWELEREASGNYSASHHRWGYVSETVGAQLRLRLPLVPQQLHPTLSTPQQRGERISAWLIYLKSSGPMGTAAVECGAGCSCGLLEVDAHMGNRASIPVLLSLDVKPDAGSDARVCEVKVTIVKKSTSGGGHRFQVMGLATSGSST